MLKLDSAITKARLEIESQRVSGKFNYTCSNRSAKSINYGNIYRYQRKGFQKLIVVGTCGENKFRKAIQMISTRSFVSIQTVLGNL